jgi:predicted RNase H-like nuclease
VISVQEAMHEQRDVGLDGCRAGLVAVTREGSQLQYAVFEEMRQVVATYRDAGHVFVDVPIGLPWKSVPVRPCDRLARTLLGRTRAPSVFPVPCREAVHAPSATEASRLNAAILRRRLSRQTEGIRAKIAQVDDLLLERGSGVRQLREVHPEVCFWALAGGEAMRHGKKTAAGRKERLAVLMRYEPEAVALVERALAETLRRDLMADDVIDATVSFITAEAASESLMSIRGEPLIDDRGVIMEMVHLDPRQAV